jgi:hypothetical protein
MLMFEPAVPVLLQSDLKPIGAVVRLDLLPVGSGALATAAAVEGALADSAAKVVCYAVGASLPHSTVYPELRRTHKLVRAAYEAGHIELVQRRCNDRFEFLWIARRFAAAKRFFWAMPPVVSTVGGGNQAVAQRLRWDRVRAARRAELA